MRRPTALLLLLLTIAGIPTVAAAPLDSLQTSGGGISTALSGDVFLVSMNADPSPAVLYDFELANVSNSSLNGDVGIVARNPNLLDGSKKVATFEGATGRRLTSRHTAKHIVEDAAYDSYDCSANDEICTIASQPFERNQLDTGKCNGDCDLGIQFGDIVDYYPRGQVVVGQRYGHGEAPSGSPSPKRYYLCGEDLPDTHGTTVYSPGDTYDYDQFRCTSGGTWKPVAICGDGVDNDGDGGADLEDPDCDSPYDTAESPQPSCPPKVVKRDLNGDGTKTPSEKVVVYDGDWTGSDCAYKAFDTTVEYHGEEPTTFYCSETGDAFTTGSTILSEDAEQFCQITRQIGGTDLFGHGANSDSIKAVRYFVPKEAIPVGYNRWATSSGFAPNHAFQHLHDAEQKYGSRTSPHDLGLWNEDRKGLVDATAPSNGGDGYTATVESDGETDFADSWTVANATGTTHPGIGDSTFPGGFAGKCSTGQQWQPVQGEWRCSGEFGWRQQVYFPEVTTFSGRTDDGRQATVGMFLMPSNFWTESKAPPGVDRSFWRAWKDEHDQEVYLDKVHAACYNGTEAPDYGTAPESWYFTVTADTPRNVEHPIPIIGKVNLHDNQNYQCEWYYELSNGDLLGETDTNQPGTVEPLDKGDSEVRAHLGAGADSAHRGKDEFSHTLAEAFDDWKPDSYERDDQFENSYFTD